MLSIPQFITFAGNKDNVDDGTITSPFNIGFNNIDRLKYHKGELCVATSDGTKCWTINGTFVYRLFGTGSGMRANFVEDPRNLDLYAWDLTGNRLRRVIFYNLTIEC